MTVSPEYLKAFAAAAALSWVVIVVLALCLAKASRRADDAEIRRRLS